MSWLPNWLTGFDTANAEAGAAADATLQAMAIKDYGPGGKNYSPANWAAVQADYHSQAAFGVDAQQQQVQDAFDQTLQDEFNSVTSVPAGLTWSVVKAFLKSIPAFVWVVVAIAAFWYLGGAAIIRKQIEKRA